MLSTFNPTVHAITLFSSSPSISHATLHSHQCCHCSLCQWWHHVDRTALLSAGNAPAITLSHGLTMSKFVMHGRLILLFVDHCMQESKLEQHVLLRR
jgi:hypothetical protein